MGWPPLSPPLLIVILSGKKACGESVNQSGDLQMIRSIEEILTSLITIYRWIERRIDHRLKHVLPASHYNMSPHLPTH